jgi:hypothetical protein
MVNFGGEPATDAALGVYMAELVPAPHGLPALQGVSAAW